MYKYDRAGKEGTNIRVYFTDRTNISLSKRKNGPLMSKLLEQIKESGEKQRNPIIKHTDYVEVLCYSISKDQVMHVLIDVDVWEKYKTHYFSVNAVSQQYCYISLPHHLERLHMVIMGTVGSGHGVHIDHINHNTFDNRRKNLRIVTPKINTRNKSFFRKSPEGEVVGVRSVSRYVWNKYKYRVRVGANSKAVNFNDYKKAVQYAYKTKKEQGYLFEESSTTIENYISTL